MQFWKTKKSLVVHYLVVAGCFVACSFGGEASSAVEPNEQSQEPASRTHSTIRLLEDSASIRTKKTATPLPKSTPAPRPLPAVEPELVTPDGRKSDFVQIAGGAIEMAVPEGWYVSEIPVGRQVQLWLTPIAPAERRVPTDGICATFHWQGRKPSQDELAAAIQSRMTERGFFSPPQVVSAPFADNHAQLAMENQNERQKIWMAATATETGIFEIAVVAARDDFVSRLEATQIVFSSLKIATPRLRTPVVLGGVQDAAAAAGLWKSLRARLRVGGDGRIEMSFDGPTYPLDEAGQLSYVRRVDVLTGSYQARQDMLLVTWDDGSRLNLRWRIDDGQLLLTDHNGRVSQLNRLVE